jgi:hypothetical protein
MEVSSSDHTGAGGVCRSPADNAAYVAMKPRILVFHLEAPTCTDACRAAFGGLAEVEVHKEPNSAPPFGPWDLVLLHIGDEERFKGHSVKYKYLLRYSTGGPVADGIPRTMNEGGLRHDEAAGIVAVIRELPPEKWPDGFQAIWANVPEAVLLAALMLQVGHPLSEELRQVADSEYQDRRRLAGERGKALPAELDDANRVAAFKALIDSLRQV